MDIRQIINDAMQKQGISQRGLAQQTGLMQPRISDYLLGKRDVQGETLNKLLEALNLEIRPKKGR
ncbi:MAG: helix-turn-helix domain-containing protein [Phycisphaerales bacterium]